MDADPRLPIRFQRTSPRQALVACSTCQRQLYVRPHKINVAQHHFCDRSCQGRWRAQHTGSAAAHWKGGQAAARGGRVKLYRPEHPDANKRGYVWRHRLVAEEKIGRRLFPSEIVHHLNGDATDDSPDNLIVLPNQSEHARLHQSAPKPWARLWSHCRNCGTTDRAHMSRGLCDLCYERQRVRTHV